MLAQLLSLFATSTLAHRQVTSRDDGVSAAGKFGWNKLVQEDHFEGTKLSDKWSVYDGPGHDGEGVRSPDAISLSNGILTITGTPDGTTGGMAWDGSQQYGRWEVRARYTPGTPAYHCVLLLWPTAEDWPVGGEVDFSEVSDGERQELEFFLHYGEDNSVEHAETVVDMTVWNNYAVEWTEDVVVGFVNGEEFFRSKKPEAVPPRLMHATIQLDWFPGDRPQGPGKMEVDWIHQYDI